MNTAGWKGEFGFGNEGGTRVSEDFSSARLRKLTRRRLIVVLSVDSPHPSRYCNIVCSKSILTCLMFSERLSGQGSATTEDWPCSDQVYKVYKVCIYGILQVFCHARERHDTGLSDITKCNIARMILPRGKVVAMGFLIEYLEQTRNGDLHEHTK